MELATALVHGPDDSVAPLPLDGPSPPPRAALEAVLRKALRRPPCVIGFSGGRDSSALLALAVHLARLEGLDPPVAATNVFPGDLRSAESRWQELVIHHVGVDAWERLRLTDEMDVVGPIAGPLLRAFGPTFPFNGHFGVPSFALAAGGSYVTGIGGDELFEPNDLSRLAVVLTGGIRPRAVDLQTALRTVGPGRLRRRHYRHLVPAEPWLRPGAGRAFVADVSVTLAGQHVWYRDQVRYDVWRDRARIALQATLAAFAHRQVHGNDPPAELVHPFQDPELLRAVARRAGRAPWRGRAAAMRELFGDVLPSGIVDRSSKATFDAIFFHEHSRAFAAQWDGTGVDTALVDVEQLRAAWRRPSVDPRSLSLLQSAWLNQTC